MPAYRHLKVEKQGDVFVVRFGDNQILDELAVAKISDELCGVASQDECQNLLLSFVDVYRLTSLMLGNLIMLDNIMRRKSGHLILCEIGPEIREVFEMTKLDRLLDIRGSESAALAAFARA